MNVGMIGLGKLGLPVATAIGLKGHTVVGYDKNPAIKDWLEHPDDYPFVEEGYNGMSFPTLVEKFKPTLAKSMAEVCQSSDVIFVAVQTPHEDRYGGTHRVPDERIDFDYSWLKAACMELETQITDRHCVVIISTVMPGTIRREILPMFKGKCEVIYNPYFIAMGTVIPDFLHPEFVLLGHENPVSFPGELLALYEDIYEDWQREIYDRTVDGGIVKQLFKFMSLESAELTKVAYNTFIGFKIGLANTFGMLCDRIPGADVDQVMEALMDADERLISTKYLIAGMGDGGGCHPRDLIAMSWLMRKHYGRVDPFNDVMKWREMHAETLAAMLIRESMAYQLPIAMYGLAFKANTGMLEGSHSILVKNILSEQNIMCHMYDPVAHLGYPVKKPHVILIGTKHRKFRGTEYPEGSVIIDPFRYMPQIKGCRIIKLGRGMNALERPLTQTVPKSDYQKAMENIHGPGWNDQQ